MLHAINQNKSKLYERYISKKRQDSAEGRRTQEDEITSIVFSPLEILPPKISGKLWHDLLKSKKSERLPNSPIVGSSHIFWPRTKDINGKPLEPDLVVTLNYESGEKIFIIIELKWNSPLSNKTTEFDQRNQLQIQWEDFKFDGGANANYHIFIGKETSEAIKAQEANDVWKGCLIKFNWFELLATINSPEFQTSNPELKNWSNLVCQFMSKVGIKAFRGFRSLQTHLLPEISQRSNLFWNNQK